MKYRRILLLLLLVPVLSASSAHKFYVSITKIEYVPGQQTLQIITKIFTDDLESALREQQKEPIFLDSKKESGKVDDFIREYLLRKIHVYVNGAEVPLQFIGKEYETDMVVAYLEAIDVVDFQNIKVKNTVLMEIFPEQKNIIHLKTETSRRSLILEKDKPSGVLDFRE